MITTLCYMEKNEQYLMLHRNKKEKDINKGKWIGVGGKLEKGETPMECILREIHEETGYKAEKCNFKGIIVFNYNDNPSEHMYLYTCSEFTGEMKPCEEGDLKWIEKEEVFKLNLWEGDKIFLDLIKKDSPFFYLTLDYNYDDLMNYKIEYEEGEFARFEVFVPEEYVENIVKGLGKYNLLDQGFYGSAYSTCEVIGHWTSLEGANPFDGEVGQKSVSPEILMKFRVRKEFKELAYYIVKKEHPYEVAVINVF
ncbi:NUDIX domain-containing protein [Peptostreptococcus faecalis]|uniref:NUDIX domain-containing protein n=1 Tax=Peptostreptococcus faecalis TaxID=2045015 RepID=UPI000C7C90DB|nr:NUDIX domain-containing protein [Peptostreptococcus faecalis]